MRTIDGDALIARLEEWNTSDSTDKALYNFTLHRILEQPTIEPERKKGKWINVRHDNVAECDKCGITGRAWMNFCFDCGADMREPEDIPMEYFESGGR